MANLIRSLRESLLSGLVGLPAVSVERSAVYSLLSALSNLNASPEGYRARFAAGMARLQAVVPTVYAKVQAIVDVANTDAIRDDANEAAALGRARSAFAAARPHLAKRSVQTRWDSAALHAVRKADFYGSAESLRLHAAAQERRTARKSAQRSERAAVARKSAAAAYIASRSADRLVAEHERQFEAVRNLSPSVD